MKLLLALLVQLLCITSVFAWNLKPMHVNALRFEKSGQILFTLFDAGLSGDEFRCSTRGGGQWFSIPSCSSSDSVCISAANRMGAMLMTAKLSSVAVHVHRESCVVTEVALKPL